MKVAVAADHGGFSLKQELVKRLGNTCSITDMGATAYNADDDYPDFAFAVARAVAAGQAERGIVICGSGVGASIAANKIKGVRAAVCHDTYSAHQGVEHDNMNVLCLGSRVIGLELALELANSFLKASYNAEESRHQRRLRKIQSAEL
jgi:ribose 5-phosphate isomerase B